jgi:hypothetical protein
MPVTEKPIIQAKYRPGYGVVRLEGLILEETATTYTVNDGSQRRVVKKSALKSVRRFGVKR